MSKDSGQKFISRNRPPRVQISYEDPQTSDKKIEIPFVMGVMSDLSGNSPGVEKKEIPDRKFANVDIDNFDDFMARIEPGAAFRVENKLGGDPKEKLQIDLKFKKMADMTPAAIARQVPALNKLLEAREQLQNLVRYMDGKQGASDKVKALLNDPKLMEALKERAEAKGDKGDGNS